MFSKTLFDHTLFSRVQSSDLVGVEARAISTASGSLTSTKVFECVANAISNQNSSIVRLYFFTGITANAVSNAVPDKVVRIRYPSGGEANAVTTSWGGNIISVTVFTLSLPDLVMNDGDILQIDTGEYTVTLNGNNAVWMVTDLSEFFKLEPGEGTITIEFEDEGEADIRILWRERYL